MLCLCHYGPALLTFWFQTDLGRENSASYLKIQAGKTDAFHFSHHSHALVTPVLLVTDQWPVWMTLTCHQQLVNITTGSRRDVFVVRTSKPVENLWKNGLFWSRYSFVTDSIDRKPRDWGLARLAHSIKYGKGGNKFGADFRIPETQMELNEIAWFY